MTTTNATRATPTTLEAAAKRRTRLLNQLATVTDQVRALAVAEAQAGQSEEKVAARAGVTRQTVRNWRGKDK